MNRGQNLENLEKYIRGVDYLTVAQIFLRDNFLLERPLKFSDIKPRLLGHWGSCPGVNRIYAQLQRAQKMLAQAESPLITGFMLGPGHAFPALQANLFLEETLAKFDKKASRDARGLEYLVRNFSWPGGFPSHASPFTPNVILEGGELGYSLSTAFGAVLDNPDLIMAVLIGDGEAETAPIATAWHLNKLINPIDNGVVLPILHLNKYKISGPTIYGAMSDFELIQYFGGAGWQVKIVDEYTAQDFNAELAAAVDEVYRQIARIKFNGKTSTQNGAFVRLPMLIVRSKKGSGGVASLKDLKIEGNSASHQVPLPEAGNDESQLRALEKWLKSYKFSELFNTKTGRFGDWLDDFLPEDSARIGRNPLLDGGQIYRELDLPARGDLSEFTAPNEKTSLSMHAVGRFLADTFRRNPKTFRFFSPDETYSNKLNAVFSQTSRSWQRTINPWEKDLASDGRVTEMLSEHSLQGLLQGYLLTGRHGALTSYEAFAPIISSMMDQYAKFLAQSQEVAWRGDIASLNYILTSTGWRQDHNGFSHQNPSFIDEVLRRQNGLGQVFLPADDSQSVVYAHQMLESTNNINVLVAGKTPEPRFFSVEQSQKIAENGGVFVYDLWREAEFDAWRAGSARVQPDVILLASGDYIWKETVAAAQVLAYDFPELKIRLVYLSALHTGGIGTFEHPLSSQHISNIFGETAPIFAAFHGYPQTLKAILFDYPAVQRAQVNGYEEKGSTTTPFDMLARNQVSRYDIAERVAKSAGELAKAAEYAERRAQILTFARENSVDPTEIEEWNYRSFYGDSVKHQG